MTEPQNEIERVIAEMGLPNLQIILASYQRFLDAVDYRKLLDWKFNQPLDDLLQPLFLKAVVTISRDLDLGDAARALAQAEDGEWQWGVRFDAARGPQINTCPDEQTARNLVGYASPGDIERFRYTAVRRRIGPWTEVRDA